MENSESDKPEKKRPHLSSVSSPMAPNSNISPHNIEVDASVLQHQHKKLVEQLNAQKLDLNSLKVSIQEIDERQSSYDDLVSTMNQQWNQMINDLVFLGVKASGGLNVVQTLDCEDYFEGSATSCLAEEIFFCRLLKVESIKNIGGVNFSEEVLAQRYCSIWEFLQHLEEFVEAQKVKTTCIFVEFDVNIATEDAIVKLSKIEDLTKDEANSLQLVIDYLHRKHSEYAARTQSYIQNESVIETEIEHTAGELEEYTAELEESRRKLVNLRMQKNLASGTYSSSTRVVNGTLSPLKLPDRSMGQRELKDSIEEAEILAADRLAELEDAHEDNLTLSKQLEKFENEMKDDKYVCTSRLYSLLNDQLKLWKAEVTRYKALMESCKSERSYLMRREKKLELKTESADSSKSAFDAVETRVEELELKLWNSVIEKNEIEIKMEETVQDLGMTDVKSEFNEMASALSKEMGMLGAQLNRWKIIAEEALSLRGAAESQKALLEKKTSEVKAVGNIFSQQMAEIKSLKELIEKLQKEKLELQIFVDMLGQGCYDYRDLIETQESERRACAQVEALKHSLDQHNLELRIKAANEAEAACHRRLSATEAEIANLKAKLDATERYVWKLTEAIKIMDAEFEAYTSEIETIGQAYEDMQTQNQHLMQKMTERDDYNIKLVSESAKTDQAVNTLLSEKQALSKKFQLFSSAMESLRARISRCEEQMKGIMSEALNYCQKDRHLSVTLERAKLELSEVEKEMKWVKSAIASSEKEHEHVQRKIAEIKKELDNERHDGKKLEELKERKDRVAEMTVETGEAAIQRLQEEIKECKSALKCGVCFNRPKEVVIMKCCHLFCNKCIQRNLQIRHRKCPGCGISFGQNDVRFVKT